MRAKVVALLVGVAVAVVLIVVSTRGGGGGDGAPSSPEDLARVLQREYDYPEDRAGCVADQVFARLSDEEVTEVQELLARDAELPADLQRKLRAAVVPCA